MNLNGLGLFLIVILILILLVAIYPIFLRKILRIYWVWFFIGMFCFIYMLSARIIPNFIETIKYGGGEHNASWGNVLMLDMCPFTATLLPILIIFDRKRKICINIAPIALFCGLISTFAIIFNDFQGGKEDVSFTLQFIFLGSHEDRMFFLFHLFLCVQSLLILLSTNVKIKKALIWSNVYFALFEIYVAICAYSLGIMEHAFGVVAGDWMPPDGEFSIVTSAFGLQNLLWLAALVGFVLAWTACFLNVLLFYFMKRFSLFVADTNVISLMKFNEIKELWSTNFL